MRNRIKKAIFARSSNKQKVVEWRQELEENHIKNSSLFMTIHQTVQVKPKTSLELFEEKLKAKIKEWRLANQ